MLQRPTTSECLNGQVPWPRRGMMLPTVPIYTQPIPKRPPHSPDASPRSRLSGLSGLDETSPSAPKPEAYAGSGAKSPSSPKGEPSAEVQQLIRQARNEAAARVRRHVAEFGHYTPQPTGRPVYDTTMMVAIRQNARQEAKDRVENEHLRHLQKIQERHDSKVSKRESTIKNKREEEEAAAM